MKAFKLPIKQLRKAANRLSSVMQQNNIIPILENVKFDISKGLCVITGTNLETTVQCEISLPDVDLSFLCPFEEFKNICSVSDGDIEFNIDNGIVNIKDGDNIFNLGKCDNFSDFPNINQISEGIQIDASSDILTAIKIIVSNILSKTDKPFYSGVSVVVKQEKLKIVSSDGCVLTEFNYNCDITEDVKVIIPETAIKAIDGIEEAGIIINDSSITFKSEGVTVLSKLIEGNVPDYEYIFPEAKNNINVNVNEFSSAIEKCIVLQDKVYTAIDLKFNADSIDFYVVIKEMNKSSKSSCKAEINNRPIESITFNSKYLQRVISHAKLAGAENISLTITSDDKGVLLTIPGNNNFKSIIQPISN